jgi:predicted ester cyclase
MNRRHLIAAAVLAALASACSEPAPPAPPPAATPAPATAEARVKLYTTCWDQFNSKALDQFQNCFADNAFSEVVDSASQPPITGRAAIMDVIKKEAESFPDRHGELKLVLANGSRIAGVALYTATNTGPMPGPDGKPMPATNKKVGLLIGHTIELDAMGTHAARESAYIEEETLAGQLGLSKHPVRPVMAASGGVPEIVIAKNDAKETANIAAVRAMIDAGNKHDMKAIEAMLTDDYKLVEIGQSKDLDKKAAIASNKDFVKAFPDITSTASDVWAAGDYVVIVGKVEGTNKGAFPGMGIMKPSGKKFTGRFLEICKMENGKVKQDWLFYNGSTLAPQLGLK